MACTVFGFDIIVGFEAVLVELKTQVNEWKIALSYEVNGVAAYYANARSLAIWQHGIVALYTEYFTQE